MADIDSSLSYFCHQVSKTHKVVLTGECADEVFGGYPWFHKEKFFQDDMFPWTLDLMPRMELLKDEVREELDLTDFVKNAYEQAVGEIEVLPTENETETRRRQIGYLNIRFFYANIIKPHGPDQYALGIRSKSSFCRSQAGGICV